MADVGDIHAMSQFALDILKSDERLASFKESAKKQAERFDIHNIIPLYEDLYLRVIGEK